MNQKSSNEELQILNLPPKIENSNKGNMIYKSSPTKMKFNQSGPHSSKGKSVQMFKPMKLSSAHNEDGESPDKGTNPENNKDLHIDITMDLSSRDLKAVPILDTLISP